MHVHMSQETSEEPLYTDIYRKNAAAQIGPRTQTHTLCEPAQSKRMSILHKSHLIRKFTVKMPQTKTAPQTLCEPAQSKRTSTCQKSHFTRKFTGKRPPDRISPGHLQSWRPEKAKALFGGFTNRTVGITRFATNSSKKK